MGEDETQGRTKGKYDFMCMPMGGNQTEGKEKARLLQTKRHTHTWKRGLEERAGYHKKCNVTTTD